MRRKGSILLLAGVLLIVAALVLTGYNLHEQRRAGEAAALAAQELARRMPVEKTAPDAQANPEREMPEEMVDGVAYIGVLQIPALSLELPIISQWSADALKTAPCRYSGSVYLNDMVLCGHNYASHFGALHSLQPGDGIIFADADGNLFRYEVAVLETLMPTAVEEMTSGGWDLTLFTCTVGGQSRVTVRCSRIG